jgi:hypothetical protein
MGVCKSRVLSEVYRVGMEPDTYFDLRIYDSHRIMFHSINSMREMIVTLHFLDTSALICLPVVSKDQARKAFRTFVRMDDECVGDGSRLVSQQICYCALYLCVG